jgi:phosphoribosylformylglycinamidine synthase
MMPGACGLNGLAQRISGFGEIALVWKREEREHGRMVKVVVTVIPKPSVLDPQGAATAEAMKHSGLTGVGRVRVGKSIEIEFDEAPDRSKLEEVARDLLSNPVIEDYRIEG